MKILKESVQACRACGDQLLVDRKALKLEDGGTLVTHGMKAVYEKSGPLKELRTPVEHVLSLLTVEVIDHHELVVRLQYSLLWNFLDDFWT